MQKGLGVTDGQTDTNKTLLIIFMAALEGGAVCLKTFNC